jgi:hypothetical protein
VRCIFCKRPTTEAEPVEHIIDEGYVGDREFQIDGSDGSQVVSRLVLTNGEVCGPILGRKDSCNSRLGRLGAYAQDQLGLFKVFLNPKGTKSGNPARFERPGLYAFNDGGHVHLVLNQERRSVTAPDGFMVRPVEDHPRSIRSPRFEVDGHVASAGFDFGINLNKKVVRWVHKVAFELLCQQLGAAHVLQAVYDPLRTYVLHGTGSRAFGVEPTAPIDNSTGTRTSLRSSPGGWICTLDLGIVFVIDLSAENWMSRLVGEPELADSGLLVRWDNQTERERRAATGATS